jgi:hypothetical protein
MRFPALLLAISAFAQQPGQSLPAWTPGTLDIHQINTGRGKAALLIFPDGTSSNATYCAKGSSPVLRPPVGEDESEADLKRLANLI